MFSGWEEYAFYIVDNIVQRDKYRAAIRHKIEMERRVYTDPIIADSFWKIIITTVLSSDWDFTKFTNWRMAPDVDNYRRFKLKHPLISSMLRMRSQRYLTAEQKQQIIDYFKEKKDGTAQAVTT